MRILYDYQAFLMQSHGGVSKCFVELISNLPDHVQFQIGIKESDNIYLEESGLVPNLCKCSKTVNNFIFMVICVSSDDRFGRYDKSQITAVIWLFLIILSR